MADEQLPKVPRRYTYDDDQQARESANTAQTNAMIAMQGASQALSEAADTLLQYKSLNNAPTFITATLQNTMVAETDRPVRYASLLAQTVRFAGSFKVGTTAAARAAGTRVFQLNAGYRPTTPKYVPVTIKDLPKGGIKLNVLGLLGATVSVSEGMTTGASYLNVSTDGWVTLGTEMVAGSTVIIDGYTMLIP